MEGICPAQIESLFSDAHCDPLRCEIGKVVSLRLMSPSIQGLTFARDIRRI
jgi:hypothetical protein